PGQRPSIPARFPPGLQAEDSRLGGVRRSSRWHWCSSTREPAVRHSARARAAGSPGTIRSIPALLCWRPRTVDEALMMFRVLFRVLPERTPLPVHPMVEDRVQFVVTHHADRVALLDQLPYPAKERSILRSF